MYQDQDSIKVFERVHARDSLKEFARHAGDSSSDNLDVLGAHARTEGREGMVITVLSIVAVAILIGALVTFLE